MTNKIVIAQPIHADARALLKHHAEVFESPGPEPLSPTDLAKHCSNAHALMAFMTERIDEAFLAHCPELRIIAGALKGYNNIDIAACSSRGIYVTVVPDLLTEPTAELALGLMISVARKFGPGDRHVRSGAFEGWRPRFYGGSLVRSTVVMIGAGAVGCAIMRMLQGFDCTKLYVDKRTLAYDREQDLGCEAANLDDALMRGDFVVLGLHLTPLNHHYVDRAFIDKMKPGSFLINPARGSLVDERAVIEALESGHLAGYAADTFEMEDWALAARPDRIPNGLLTSEKTVLTPHIGSAVTDVRIAIEVSAAHSINEALAGRMPETAVNKDSLAMIP
ncbi:MAG: NAD(P)-dependent oxidoreductase [Pseudomonadota bacterium]